MKCIILGLSIAFGAVGQILFKKGMTSLGGFEIGNIINILLNPSIFMGFVFYGTSSIMWLYTLSKFQLSTVYPMLSIGYVVVAIAGYYLFNEAITVQKVISIALISAGVVLINLSS